LLGEDKKATIGLSNPLSLSFFLPFSSSLTSSFFFLSFFLALLPHFTYLFPAFLQVVATFEISFFLSFAYLFLFFYFYPVS